MDKIKQSLVLKKIRDISNNTLFLKTILVIGGWVVAFIPVYISAFFWWLIGPTTVVERFVTITLFLVLLGWLQVMLIVGATIFTVGVIEEL